MTLREFCSQIFGYRIKEGDEGWKEASQQLAQNGMWSLTTSPKKFQEIILELCKRVDKLEIGEKVNITYEGTIKGKEIKRK